MLHLDNTLALFTVARMSINSQTSVVCTAVARRLAQQRGVTCYAGTGPLSQRSAIAKVRYRKGPGLGLGLGLVCRSRLQFKRKKIVCIQSSPPWTFAIADLCDSGPESLCTEWLHVIGWHFGRLSVRYIVRITAGIGTDDSCDCDRQLSN